MIAVSERVRLVRADNPSPMTLEGTNTYLVGSGDDVLIVDPGPADRSHLDAVRGALDGARVTALLLTHRHPDHAAGARMFADALGAPVAAWGRDGSDVPIHDGARIGDRGAFVTAIHTPGHAADHVCFLYDDDRVLFSGDHVLGRGTSVIVWPDGDLAAYMASLERLRPLHISRILPGHGPVVTDPRRVIAEYIEHRLMRERQIVDQLGAAPGTPADLVKRIYTDVAPHLHAAAELSVRAHLAKLEGEGRAVSRDGVWRPA